MMSATRDRVNFRCSKQLRSKLEEASKRSGVKLSEQVRVSLERMYQVEPDQIWLPPTLQSTDAPPTPSAPGRKKS